TDVYVNFAPSPYANVQVGQFFLPFGLENRVGDNVPPFLERSITTRGVAAPFNRDIGASFWGETPNRLVQYVAGVFNGDGPNRINADNKYDFAGRVVVRPFAPSGGTFRDLSVGISGRFGSKDARLTGYDVSSLSTQGGYALWRPTYRDSFSRVLHILPSGD